MKYILLFIALLLPAYVFSQTVNFEDDFSDQDISDWSGDTGDFTFTEENGNILLQQDAPEAGTSYLSIPSTNVVGVWEFFVRMDFAPSGGNKTDFYLMSDNSDFTGSINGYFLQAGEGLSADVFRLFKITNGSKDGEILTGSTNISSGGDYRVRVTRDASGNWILEVGIGYDGILTEEDSGMDNEYSSASHFGFITTYTGGNTDNFVFDFKINLTPVEVETISMVNDTDVDVTFSKEIDFNSIQNSDFILTPGNLNPQSIAEDNSNTARLTFSNPLPSGPNQLDISGVDDLAGETTLTDTTFSFTVFDEFQNGDVIINEFLKDPPTGAEEYVELKNTSSRYLNLKDWQLGDDGNLATISNTDFALLPDSFVVVSKNTTSNIDFFGHGNYKHASLPAFNNGVDQVRLYDRNNSLIDSLEYNSDWGGVKVAIERRDASVPAEYIENWGESPAENSGTPGLANQVEADETAPFITSLTVQDDQTLIVAFSERLEAVTAQNLGNFELGQNPQSEVNTPPLPTITSVNQIAPDTLEISLDAPLQEYDGTWILNADNLTDIFGNTSDDENEFNYYVIFTAEPGQVVINEFMYDPAAEFSEFVELYNHSDSSFDLQDWTFNDNTGNRRSITTNSYVLSTGKFVILAPDSTIAENFPGTSILEMRSRFSALNNSFDDIVIRNQNGIRIDSLTYASSWGGNEVSLERRDADIPGTFQENWGASPSFDFATPALPNLIEADETPPQLASISLIGDDLIQLIFSERLLNSAAENISNYELSVENSFNGSIPSVQAVTFAAPDTVLLKFDAALISTPDGTTYEIIIANQTDVFNNTAGELTEEFFIVDFAEPDFGEVAINEFMYDPSNEYSEFIELRNVTDSTFNLRGWTYNDNTGNRRIISTINYALNPGGYILLTPDSTIIHNLPEIPAIVMGNQFSTLNNNTDAIVIRDYSGGLVDSLTYTSDWGGKEVSLERKKSDFSAVFRENWGDSPSPVFATPGRKNEIEPDNDPPVIEDAYIVDADSIRIVFNERIDSVLATNPANYSLHPAISVADIWYEETAVLLLLNNSLNDSETYTITTQNQEDIFGNKLITASVELEFIAFSESFYSDVIINEILYRRASAESPEFIELYNNTSRNFDLTNWSFSDAISKATIPAGNYLRSGEYIILTDQEDFAEEMGNGVYLSSWPSLNDDEDAVVIKDNNGNVIDSLLYSNTWGNHQPGVSLERKDPEAASNDASNWASNTSEGGTSINSESSVFEPDVTAPEIIFAKLQPDNSIFVAFSEFIDVDEAAITIIDQEGTIADFNEANGNIVILEGVDFEDGENINIIFQNISDVKGNTRAETSVEVAQPISARQLVINEIMFDPLANSDDNLPDQTEYLELYNRADYAISLEGFFLHDEPDENNEVRSIFPVSSQFKWIPPKEYVLIYSENTATTFAESQLAKYFKAEDRDEHFSIWINRSSLSLASSGDAIYLADSSGTIIDSVFYDESWQNPNLHSTKGIALERIDPDGPSDDNSNWSSSTNISGGTPGWQNSIFQQAGAGPLNTGITFTPNPFSPDDDGFDDILFINYKLDESDYLLRIRIFDRYGREVRELTDGKPAGFEGSLIWDGLTDSRRKNRVGIYIVLFEAYNSANGKNVTFKETVVLARKF
ncbi:MAG: lamin tail domain-containing protein [Balneolaceae bacterium]